MVIFNCILKAFKLIGFSRFSHACDENKKREMETKADVKNGHHQFISFYSRERVYVLWMNAIRQKELGQLKCCMKFARGIP